MKAHDGVLLAQAGMLTPHGLLDATPTVIGMRVLNADPELVCDIVVDPAEISPVADAPESLLLPDTGLSAAWAGIAPPKSGWEPVGEIDSAVLTTRAEQGIREVADQLPAQPGEDITQRVRAAVWGRHDDELGGLAQGVAFAAFALGFVKGQERARVFSSGRWTRLSLARGHVLLRGPAATGLTPVRKTGA